MRLLLDESVPARLARALRRHEVRTVVSMGWSGVKNGRLQALLPLVPVLEAQLSALEPRVCVVLRAPG